MKTLYQPVLYFLLMVSLASAFVGCKKFLDPKPLQSMAIPSSLQDLQALLDNDDNLNGAQISATEVSSDDYYLTPTDLAALTNESRRMYTWEKDYIFRPTSNDWFLTYRNIYTANVVLDNIDQISRNNANQQEWDNVKGQALFTRARHFFSATLTWTLPYDAATASSDPGIPLRLSGDFNIPSSRANVAACYHQIITDLTQSAALLATIPVAKTRASKNAAWGMLGRVYLSMGNIDSCFKYVDLYLQNKRDLIDYNTDITASANTPFQRFNKEVCFDSYFTNTALSQSRAKVDSSLYRSYDANDLRKTAFFRSFVTGTYGFKGNYSIAPFTGIATNEVYLMRAECYARKEKKEEALADLNTLMIKRWKTNTFTPFRAQSAAEALQIILRERRKELLFRSLRWMDLRRLNKEGANIVLVRKLGNQTYQLPANDKRYALAIPEDLIELSGLQQNER